MFNATNAMIKARYKNKLSNFGSGFRAVPGRPGVTTGTADVSASLAHP